jgi:HEAT repeat protein
MSLDQYLHFFAALLTDKHENIRKLAVDLIKEQGSRATGLACELAQIPGSGIQYLAIEILEHIGGGSIDAITVVRRLFEDKSYPHRGRLITCLASIGGGSQSTEALLIGASQDADEEVRVAAVGSMCYLPPNELFTEPLIYALRDASRAVRAIAQRALMNTPAPSFRSDAATAAMRSIIERNDDESRGAYPLLHKFDPVWAVFYDEIRMSLTILHSAPALESLLRALRSLSSDVSAWLDEYGILLGDGRANVRIEALKTIGTVAAKASSWVDPIRELACHDQDDDVRFWAVVCLAHLDRATCVDFIEVLSNALAGRLGEDRLVAIEALSLLGPLAAKAKAQVLLQIDREKDPELRKAMSDFLTLGANG